MENKIKIDQKRYKYSRIIRRLDSEVNVPFLFDNQNPLRIRREYYGRISGIEVKLRIGSKGDMKQHSSTSTISARTEEGLKKAYNRVLDYLCGVVKN